MSVRSKTWHQCCKQESTYKSVCAIASLTSETSLMWDQDTLLDADWGELSNGVHWKFWGQLLILFQYSGVVTCTFLWHWLSSFLKIRDSRFTKNIKFRFICDIIIPLQFSWVCYVRVYQHSRVARMKHTHIHQWKLRCVFSWSTQVLTSIFINIIITFQQSLTESKGINIMVITTCGIKSPTLGAIGTKPPPAKKSQVLKTLTASNKMPTKTM